MIGGEKTMKQRNTGGDRYTGLKKDKELITQLQKPWYK